MYNVCAGVVAGVVAGGLVAGDVVAVGVRVAGCAACVGVLAKVAVGIIVRAGVFPPQAVSARQKIKRGNRNFFMRGTLRVHCTTKSAVNCTPPVYKMV